MSDVKKRAIDLASYDALIHCISWMDIKSTLVDLVAECERLESLVCKACNGVGSVGRMTVDGWEDDDCPYCVGQIKDQVRMQAARECVELIQKMGEQRMVCTYNTSDHVRVRYSVAVIRQHFGLTDRFAGAGKVMEGSDSVRN